MGGGVNSRISSAAGAREAADNRTSSAGVAREVVNYRTNAARGDEMLLISGAAMLERAERFLTTRAAVLITKTNLIEETRIRCC